MKISRGGVEDTRIEVKTKETKKNPRSRTAFPRTDPLEAKDRNARGQGHKGKCSPKKKGLQKFFQAFFNKKRLLKSFFQAIYKISTIQKKCCPRAEDRAIFEDLRLRSQGLDLRGQGLENVSSRTSSRLRTSSRTPPLTISLWKIYPKCKTKRKFNEYTSKIDPAGVGK